MNLTFDDTLFSKLNTRRGVATQNTEQAALTAFKFSVTLLLFIGYVVWLAMAANSNSHATRMLRNECRNVSLQVSELEKNRQNRLAELEHLKDGHRITAAALRLGLRPADTPQTVRRCDVVYRHVPSRPETLAQNH